MLRERAAASGRGGCPSSEQRLAPCCRTQQPRRGRRAHDVGCSSRAVPRRCVPSVTCASALTHRRMPASSARRLQPRVHESPRNSPAHTKEFNMADQTIANQRDGRLSRRGFLGRTLTFGVAACAGCGPGGWLGPGDARAQAKREIKFSHGTGLCNMPLFYAAEKKLFAKYAIESNVVLSGWAGDQAIQLATGKVEMGVIPYTNAIAAYTRSPSFSVVSGSGTQGLIMVGQPAIKTFADMRGKRVG